MKQVKKAWQAQLPTGGNNIPESHLRRFSIGRRAAPEGEPEDRELARFLKEELGNG